MALKTLLAGFVKVKVAQLSLALCYPMDYAYSLAGPSVQGILQARIL